MVTLTQQEPQPRKPPAGRAGQREVLPTQQQQAQQEQEPQRSWGQVCVCLLLAVAAVGGAVVGVSEVPGQRQADHRTLMAGLTDCQAAMQLQLVQHHGSQATCCAPLVCCLQPSHLRVLRASAGNMPGCLMQL